MPYIETAGLRFAQRVGGCDVLTCTPCRIHARHISCEPRTASQLTPD